MTWRWKELGDLFTQPTKFYDRVTHDTEPAPAFLTFLLCYSIIPIVAAVGINFIQPMSIGKWIGVLIVSEIAWLIRTLFVFGLGSAITHLGVLMLGGKRGGLNTFMPYAYSFIIQIPYILLGLVVYASTQSYATPFGHGMGESAPIRDLLVIGLLAIAILHALWNEILGLHRCQALSKWKALFAAMLPYIVFIPLNLLYIFIRILPGLG